MRLFTSTLTRNLLSSLAFAAVAVFLVYMVGDYTTSQVGTLGAYICAALGLTVLIGGNGQVSLGHAALMAVGAYTMAKFLGSQADALGRVSLGHVLVGLVAAGLVSLVVGIIIGLAAARLRGPYLAGATLAMGAAVPGLAAFFRGTFNGEQGLPTPAPDVPAVLTQHLWIVDRYVALISVLTAAVILFVVSNLKRSAVGRHLAAVRDNEIAAQLCGLSVPREQITAFALSAVTAGVGGACLSLVLQGANPTSFSLGLSLLVLGAVVLGGLGSLRGAIVGSVVVVFLARLLENLKANDNLPTLVFGSLLIAVMLAAPGGLMRLFSRLRGRLPRRRPQHQPAQRQTPQPQGEIS